MYSFQEQAYKYFYQKDGKVYLAFDTGLGKTLTSLNIAKDFKKVLILCPASVKFVWSKEMEKFNLYPEYFEIHSYDFFREHYNEILQKNFFDLIIFDEAHKLKNIKARITKICMKIFPKREKIMLSATPFEKLDDFYSQLKILTTAHYFHQIDYTAYKRFFFNIDPWGKILSFLNEDKEKFFYENLVYPYVWFLKKEDVIDLPAIIEDALSIPTKSYFKSRFNKVVNQDNALSFFITQYYKESLSKDKIQFIGEFIQNNANTIVFSFFREPLWLLREHFKIDHYYIDGSNKKDLAKACTEGGKPILTTYALKEGVNLTHYSNIVFLSLPLAYRDYYQSVSRLHRIGQNKKVYVVKVLSSKIDRYVNKIIQQKRNLLEELQRKTIEEIKEEIELCQ
ncbi:MAG: SNF2-related protein [Caldisericum sp.]|uniref:SNF2-related protein n=1 Tax=Caldisericum sp. TaxID=2499687 RepID=UPI003D121BB7